MEIWFKSSPFSKAHITLALESGIDGLIVPEEHLVHVNELARCNVISEEYCPAKTLCNKEDEENFVQALQRGENIILAKGWGIIPLENILAKCSNTSSKVNSKVSVEVSNLQEAILASKVLECGVNSIVLLPEALSEIKQIVQELKLNQAKFALKEATITKVQAVGLGHRVCVDTLSILQKGQGCLVGNSSAFCFLVHAETEDNTYVRARPFRINAGAVHSYTMLPHDKTCYLEELRAGDNVLIVHADGTSSLSTVGRVKVELRPMLLIEAKAMLELEGKEQEVLGTIFLQNAETICLTQVNGEPISVVSLQEGQKILCHIDKAGRHFGMRINENIQEL